MPAQLHALFARRSDATKPASTLKVDAGFDAFRSSGQQEVEAPEMQALVFDSDD